MKKIILINLILIGTLSSNKITAQTKNDTQFKTHLTMVYEHYINLEAALVKSNPETAKAMAKEAQRMFEKLKSSGEALSDKEVWEKEKTKLIKDIDGIANANKIEVQRQKFATLSITLHKLIKHYGVFGMKTYYQQCPMALDGKGAFWLSLREEVVNPYGKKMLTCGETKEIIE